MSAERLAIGCALALMAVAELPAVAADPADLAGDATVSAELTTVVELHEDRDPFVGNEAPRQADTSERIDLRAANAGWTAVTVLTAYGRLGTADDPARRDVVDLEELSVGGPLTKGLHVQGGDLRPRFGRGLLLDFTSCCERAGPASTLRGARVVFETGPVELTALGGVVHVAPLDPVSEMVLEPRDDSLAGARLVVRPVDWASVALHAVAASLAPPEGVTSASAELAGAAIELRSSGSGTAVFAEAAIESLSIDGHAQPGTAALLALDQDLGPVTLLVEAKSYEQFDLSSLTPTLVVPEGPPPLGGWPGPPVVRYHAPPTLERPGEMLPADTNTLGGRATATVRMTRSLTLQAAWVRQFFFAARGDEDRGFARGTSVQHPYGEARLSLPSGVDVAVGGGATRSVDAQTRELQAWANHLEARAELPIGAGASIAVQADWRRRLHQGRESTLAGAGVTLRLGSAASVGARYEWSDEVPDLTQGDAIQPRRHFVSLEARGRVGAIELFGLVGSTPGGLRCLDGACRTVPPFVGARLGARARF